MSGGLVPMVTKRRRRSKATVTKLDEAIISIVETDQPTTCRSVFYRLVSMGLIDKTEKEYKNAVIKRLGNLRRREVIPYWYITDGTRLRRKPSTHGSLAQMLKLTKDTYRRALWMRQDVYVEIWSEKEAIAGVLHEVTEEWDVPLLVCRGYPSITYLWNAAEEISSYDKPAYLYYFGDWDPSGKDISRNVEEQLRGFAPNAEIHFERVAVRPEQIDEWNLPTRPTKQTDSRAKTFKGESVEVDAIEPAKLRQMVESCITQHVDERELEATRRTEEAERVTLAVMANIVSGAA